MKKKYTIFPSDDPNSHILYEECEFGNYFIQSYDEVKPLEDDDIWSLEFYGSFSSSSSRVEVVLISPEGDMSAYSFKLDFPNTNNMTQYEVLLLGLHEARLKGIKLLTSKGDVELIVKQVRGLYVVKNDLLKQYQNLIWENIEFLEAVNIKAIPRSENS